MTKQPQPDPQPGFTGRKAIHLNMQEDGLRLRASTFRNKKRYSRKGQSRPSASADS